MTNPKEDAKPGSMHVLSAGSLRMVFEWTGDAWSTPGIRQMFTTSPSGMAALGWRYFGPFEEKEPTK